MIAVRWLTAILLSCLFLSGVNGSIFDYFLPQKQNRLAGTEIDSMPSVPYEVATNDEKFLQEASKLIGVNLSELDVCHHRVVLKLRNSCHELNAEQLGKLSVMLLNCQSHSEGRPMFECTENMSLKECTTDMDSDLWNAYHLITNRAKAVCVAIRHQQFRGLTEITVNKLMSTAHDQIAMMKQLSENQNRLRDLTETAIDEISEKNDHLISQQKEILQVSDAHRSAVESNLNDLMREKGLIRSGQIEVARMIDHLKGKIDESIGNLKQHSQDMKQNHQVLLDDLSELQSNAFRLSDKLGDTTEYILSQNEIASAQFDQTIKRLSDINETINKLASLMQTIEQDVDRKLAWITNKIGGTDEVLANMNLILQHFGYLLFGMLLLVFVNASPFYRIFFIMIVPANFACTLFGWRNVNLIELTQILGAVIACNLIRQFLMTINLKNPFSLSDKKRRVPNNNEHTKANSSLNESETEREATPEQQNRDEYNENNNDYSYSYVSAFKNRYRLNNTSANRERSLTPSNASNRSMTPFTTMLQDRIRCTALTMKGDQCRNAAIHDKLYCRTHNKQT